MNQRRFEILAKCTNKVVTIITVVTIVTITTAAGNISRPDKPISTELRSPRINTWGNWGVWDNCSEGDYVFKVKLRVESNQGYGDDTGLNAIRLSCLSHNQGAFSPLEYELQSVEGIWGDWAEWQSCGSNSVATGFRLRSLSYQGIGDDVDAVDFKLLCSGLDSKSETPGSQLLNWGEWTAEQRCPSQFVLCGFTTQVHPLVGLEYADDDTALSNVDMTCCKIKHPSATCTPSYEWNAEANCTKGRHCTAVFTAEIVNTEDNSGSLTSPQFYENLGFGSDINLAYPELKNKFENSYSKIYDNAIEELINELTKTPFEAEATFLGCETAIESLVLKCEMYSIKTRVYRCQP